MNYFALRHLGPGGALALIRGFRGWILPLAVLAAGSVLSAMGSMWLLRLSETEAAGNFNRLVEREAEEVRARFLRPVYGLNGARGVYATHPLVRRSQFRAYVASRNLPTEFPGVRGFGFIERVDRSALPAFIAAERADGAPEFTIRQLASYDGPDRFIIKFIEPAANNLGAMGVDLASEAVRRQAALQAVDTGEATVSGIISLVQDRTHSAGVLLLVPVFHDAPPGSQPDARGALRGLLYSPIVISELLSGLSDVSGGQTHVELFDTASGTTNGQRFYSSSPEAGTALDSNGARAAKFDVMTTVNVPGRLLTMRVTSTPGFEAAYSGQHALWFGLGGVFASLLLAALMRQQVTSRGRAEALASAMTADVERLALVARRTSNAVVITDVHRRITWVNEGFERVTGYTANEVIGLSPGSLLQFEGTNPATVQALRAALTAGEPFRGEILNRGKRGQVYWLDLDVQPLHDAKGLLIGFMAIELDITARKAAERSLARERQSLQNIIEGTQVGTWEWNVETGELKFNERWAQMMGRTLAEVGHTTIKHWIDLSHPDDLRQSALALEQHFDGLKPSYECEMRVRHVDGHWVWLLARGKLFSRSEDGRPRWMAGTHMDITERKLAEAALRAKETLLSQTGRIGGVGGWELDVATQEITWTDETCRIHDLPPGHRPTLAEAVAYYTPESRERIESAVAEGLASGKGWDLELPLVTARGRRIWVRALGEAEFVGGQAVRLLGAFQDITERRALEEELQAKNDLVNSVIENLPCGLSVFDANLRLVAANREFRRLLEFPDSLFAAPAVHFEDIIRFNAQRGEYGEGEIDATVRQIVDRARQPASPHRFERVRPNGMPLEISGAPMPGGGFVTTYTDLSDRKAAEAEVQRSANLLRAAIDAIDEAFVLYDPQDRLVLCNDKYRQIYPSLAHLTLPGSRFEDLIRAGAEARAYPDAIGREEAWVSERLAAHYSGDTSLLQRLSDGRTLRVVERKMPDGHIVGFRIDITELVQATEAAEKASLAKSQFLANMSHEIRTPMNAILGMLTLLQRTELSVRQADYAAKTEGAARSLLGLLNDILDFSKVEAGKMTLDPQPFSVDQLLRDLGVVLSANVGPKPVELLFDIDSSMPQNLVGDAMRLQQVLINLGGNAIKFTEQGEVVITAEVLRRHGQSVTVQVTVRDTGIGIAPENQARIFSGFTQAEASTTRRFGGTGLGLAISQRLVAMMGGDLQLQSAPGMGSTFFFTLTLPVAAAAEVTPACSPAPLRALVVDDNPTSRELLRHMAEDLGWMADVADSGAAALDLLEARKQADERYDVVLLDWQMPGLDGLETAQRIRHDGLVEGTPVVVMVSAQGREKLEERSAQEQAVLDGYLVKPVTASMLLDAVAAARHERAVPILTAVPSEARTASLARLQGMRLLLAEDNPTNQQVARELLEAEGAVVQIARNGLESVEAVATANPPFDVVLMDLQMPVMDGFTATAQIRQVLRKADLPIVAMTANALASDREACLASGMNDHIGKPFDLDPLVALLKRLAGRTSPPPSAAAIQAEAQGTRLPADAQAAADRAGVDWARALQRMGGKLDVYARMLHSTLKDFRGFSQTLQMSIDEADLSANLRALHTVKGLAATLGLEALAKEAASVEKQMTDGPSPEAGVSTCMAFGALLEASLPALSDLADGLKGSPIRATAQSTSGQTVTPLQDPTAWTQHLEKLANLLEQSDMRATELIPGLRMLAAHPADPRLDELDDAVGSLQFEHAAILCRRLLSDTSS